MRGRPRERPVCCADSAPYRINPTKSAQIDLDTYTAVETTPLVVEEDSINYASQAHILKVLELMGCRRNMKEVGGDSHTSISGRKWRLPHIDIRQEVECANEFDTGSMQRIENVFLRGIKAWICMLLPNLKVKCDADMRNSVSGGSHISTCAVH